MKRLKRREKILILLIAIGMFGSRLFIRISGLTDNMVLMVAGLVLQWLYCGIIIYEIRKEPNGWIGISLMVFLIIARITLLALTR